MRTIIAGVIIVGIIAVILFARTSYRGQPLPFAKTTPATTVISSVTPAPLPEQVILNNDYQVYQSFNNCGPASLSMALSYYDIHESQETLGKTLRPYQNPQGDNDDKSVTLSELAKKAEEYGLVPVHRPNGSIDLMKHVIALGMPVLTRTWLKENEDIGHYRVVKGYDDKTGEILQDDSMQGHNLRYSYKEFESIWEKFNYEYLVLVPRDKHDQMVALLGEDNDETTAWTKAAERSRNALTNNPDNIYERFNLSVALYYSGDYQGSVTEFEKVEASLPKRTLWYQIEPILAYTKLGNGERVFAITEQILSHENRAFSELYLIRGDLYAKQGDSAAAKTEYEKAVQYNTGLKEAKDKLAGL